MRQFVMVAAALLLTATAYARGRPAGVEALELPRHGWIGRPTGACPGYVRDHIIPLCKGGPDTVTSMQWQTVQDAKAQDRYECKR